jgi:hypothetical protein
MGMNIYLGYSPKNIDQHIQTYRLIREVVLNNGHKVMLDRMDRIFAREQNKDPNTRPTDVYYKDVIGAIDESELCIFIANEQTMAIGYQIMYAAGKKKHTLVLGSTKSNIPIEHVFIAGSGSAYLDFKSYTNGKDLEKYIQRFIKKNEKQAKARLSLHLEKPLYDALVLKAKKEGRTKSEMLEILVAERKKELEKSKK